MTKLASLLQLGLALVLLVPVYMRGPQSTDALRAKHAASVAALNELAAIEPRLATRDAKAIADLTALTEAPLELGAEPAALDATLESLRAEVGELAAELDRVDSTQPDIAVPAEPAGVGSADPEPKAFESEGYVADPLRLARACQRAGQHERALALFEGAGDSIAAQYGRAQCLEKLGQSREAAIAYARIAAAPDGGWFAARAAEDLEFVEWKLAFERAVSARKERR